MVNRDNMSEIISPRVLVVPIDLSLMLTGSGSHFLSGQLILSGQKLSFFNGAAWELITSA